MADTNYVGTIVKIIEPPQQEILQKDILFVKFRAQLPQIRQNRIIRLTFWGNLAKDVLDYYKVNDYILIEGYLSLTSEETEYRGSPILRKPEITVFKIYPFLFSQD